MEFDFLELPYDSCWQLNLDSGSLKKRIAAIVCDASDPIHRKNQHPLRLCAASTSLVLSKSLPTAERRERRCCDVTRIAQPLCSRKAAAFNKFPFAHL